MREIYLYLLGSAYSVLFHHEAPEKRGLISLEAAIIVMRLKVVWREHVGTNRNVWSIPDVGSGKLVQKVWWNGDVIDASEGHALLFGL